MLPSDDNKTGPEASNDNQDSVVKIDASGDEGLDVNSGDVDGVFAEIAREVATEQKGNASQGGVKAQSTAQKDQTMPDDRLLLRDHLLRQAPNEAVMRAQVVRELKAKKTALELEIRKLEKTEEYDLLSTTLGQLRAVIRQLRLAARASYEALREIWLKVVHKFA